MKQPRIIGGVKSDEGRFPYYAVMNGRSLCGAVLISPRFVLTAAHCQDADMDFAIGPKAFGDGVVVKVEDMAVHPLYDEFTFENDVTLFKLSEDAMLKSETGELVPAPYITLSPDRIDEVGYSMTVIGFGDIDPEESNTQFSDNLRQTDVNFVSNEDCRRAHRGEITEEMMCAAAPGKDACYGDSGGPLIKLSPSGNYTDDRLVGIVSWGRGCADANYPGVYTRISYFYDWIIGSMCVMGMDSAPPYVDCATILGLAPSDAPAETSNDIAPVVITNPPTANNIPTEAPTLAPTANPTAQPTVLPTALPTDKKTLSPVPPLDPISTCRVRGEACEINEDCCSDRCNFFKKTCNPASDDNRNRLSLGLGGSAGGTISRAKKRAFSIFGDIP
jgi:hypothetical protein